MNNYNITPSKVANTTYHNSTLTPKEIAGCRGESQHFFVRFINQLKLLCQGKVVNDAAITKILESEDNRNAISLQFTKALESFNSIYVPSNDLKELKQIKKEVNQAKDLATIFSKTLPPDSKLHQEWQDSLQDLQKAQDILKGRIALEKYDPIHLLKACNYYDIAEIKQPPIIKDFARFLSSNTPYPTDEACLKKTYEDFVISAIKQAKDNEISFNNLKNYHLDKPLDFYWASIKVGNIQAEKIDQKNVTSLTINLASIFPRVKNDAQELVEDHSNNKKKQIEQISVPEKTKKNLEQIILHKTVEPKEEQLKQTLILEKVEENLEQKMQIPFSENAKKNLEQIILHEPFELNEEQLKQTSIPEKVEKNLKQIEDVPIQVEEDIPIHVILRGDSDNVNTEILRGDSDNVNTEILFSVMQNLLGSREMLDTEKAFFGSLIEPGENNKQLSNFLKKNNINESPAVFVMQIFSEMTKLRQKQLELYANSKPMLGLQDLDFANMMKIGRLIMFIAENHGSLNITSEFASKIGNLFRMFEANTFLTNAQIINDNINPERVLYLDYAEVEQIRKTEGENSKKLSSVYYGKIANQKISGLNRTVGRTINNLYLANQVEGVTNGFIPLFSSRDSFFYKIEWKNENTGDIFVKGDYVITFLDPIKNHKIEAVANLDLSPLGKLTKDEVLRIFEIIHGMIDTVPENREAVFEKHASKLGLSSKQDEQDLKSILKSIVTNFIYKITEETTYALLTVNHSGDAKQIAT